MSTMEHAESPELEVVDPELMALAPPLSAWRWLTFSMMGFTAACAIALALMLRVDVAYVFSPGTPQVLGNVLAADPGDFESNRFVRIEGSPMVSNAVYYRRALGGDEYVTFSLAGQRDVWVQVPIDGGDRHAPFGRREFEGRLVRIGDLGGRFDAVQSYLAGTLHQPIDGSAYLLLADEAPTDYVGSIGLVLLVLSFVLVDAYLILRWFKPLADGAR